MCINQFDVDARASKCALYCSFFGDFWFGDWRWCVILCIFSTFRSILCTHSYAPRRRRWEKIERLMAWKGQNYGSTTRNSVQYYAIWCDAMWCDACYVNYISICLMEWNPLFNPSMAIRCLFANLQAHTDIPRTVNVDEFISGQSHHFHTCKHSTTQHIHIDTAHSITVFC